MHKVNNGYIYYGLPSGKHTQRYGKWKFTISAGKTRYKFSFSIAISYATNYQGLIGLLDGV